MRRLNIIFYLLLPFLFAGIAAAQESFPDLTITSIGAPVSASTQETISISWTVKNQGDGAVAQTGDWGYDRVYFSNDNALDDSDTRIVDISRYDGLAAGASYTVGSGFIIPENLAGGVYYIFVETDAGKQLFETNEANNVLSKPVSVSVPDVTIISIDAPVSVSTQETISISWTVKNQGDGAVAKTGNWGYDRVYFSNDNALDDSDTRIVDIGKYDGLAAGASYTAGSGFIIPENLTGGVYYIFVETDAGKQLFETNEANNVLSKPVSVSVPDLTITSIDAPVSATTQETISISWTVNNQGDGGFANARGWEWWYDQLYFSKDNALDDSDTRVAGIGRYVGLTAGASYTAGSGFAIPENLCGGVYYIFVETDAGKQLFETNEANNVLSKPISISIYPYLPNPQNVTAAPLISEVQLVWDAIPDTLALQHYAVYMHSASFSSVSGMFPVFTTTQTQANVIGLQPNTVYYFAVTAVDISGKEKKEVTAVTVTTAIDIQGPELTNIKWDNSAFTDGQVLIHPAEFAIAAADSFGISKVEFYINGNLYKADTDAPYSFCWNIAQEIDGAHNLKIIAYDSFANSTTLEYTANLTLAPPLAPGITHPVSGQAVNNSSITLTGNAEPESEVIFYNNNTESLIKAIADKTGAFSVVLSLTVGENKIQAAAGNRAGIGGRCTEVVVTYDNTVPNPPRQLTSESKENGTVKISWQAPLGTIAKGYNIYRAAGTFSNKADAVKINSDLIAAVYLTDLPQEEGIYYYRATAVSPAGNESDLSNEVIGISDNTPPKAVSIAYTPKGNYDSVTGTIASGRVDIILTLSEKLQLPPFLSITPQEASPIPVELIKNSDIEYTGSFIISDIASSGTAYAVFSARDIAGNRGTEILEGRTIKIDTQGPSIIDLKIEPKSPVKNDTARPANITVTIGLDEQSKNGETPQFSYKLSASGRAAQSIFLNKIATTAGHTETWQGIFVLPSDAGLNEVETFEFSYSASDSLGNIGTAIKPLNQFQVYQNNLPPLEIPADFKGQSLPKGKIKLSWDTVAGALDYQIYRRAPLEQSLAAYARTGDAAEYADQPADEGEYLYTISSVRKENNQEAVSAMSASLSLISDSTAPPPPKNFSLELISAGIKAQWQAAENTEAVTYSLYRANTDIITSVEGLSAILKGITQLTAIDSNPSQSDHAYVVTAVDAAGNESQPSNSFYLNFELLPVSGISVTQADNSAPVISWARSAIGIAGYNIYLGAQENKVKLNPSLLINNTYTDTGYTKNNREYSVTAADNNSIESIARSIFLPKIEAALKENSAVKRGLMNLVEFSVQNQSGRKIDNARVKARLYTYEHASEVFSIEANETKIIPLVIGGYSDIPDTADFVTTVEITPNAGEKAGIIRNSRIDVQPGVLAAGIQNEEFTRGGAGTARFTLHNTGSEEIEIITASGANPSAEIKFLLLDADGNVLSALPFKQNLGESVVTLSNGTAVARIKPGEIFSSAAASVPVPLNAPDKVYVKLDISKVHYNLGKDTHVEISGISTIREISLIDTVYYGEITSVTPLTSRGSDDITIIGRAINRSTSRPLALTPLKLVITVQGFERKSDVYTDSAGTFTYKFKPQGGECGVYKVCAIHPDLLDRPTQAQFTINYVNITPSQINLNIPRNYEQALNISAQAGEGTDVNNLRLVYEAADQPEGILPLGVHVSLDSPIPILTAGQSANLSFKLWADNNAADSGTFVLKVKSGDVLSLPKDETPADAWGSITLHTQFSAAEPVLSFSPNYVETGAKFGDAVTETVTLENKGFADLRDVKLSLVTTVIIDNKPVSVPAPSWVMLNVAPELGNIAVGAKKEAVISFAPKEGAVSEGIHSFKLRITSANYQVTDINLYTTVTQAGIGKILFKISDIFTGTLDNNNQLIQGLSGAAVTIQNDLVTSIMQSKAADGAGEALFEDLPSGSYKYWVSADKHSRRTGRIWVKPGLTVREEVFLSYDLVKVEWSVRETTVQDKYEIILTAAYETDVPAAVVVAEPKSFTLPDMRPGDVFNAEVRFTNYGLIRADNIKLNIPLNDQYFDYSALTAIPTSIDANQSVIVPVRLVCKQSLSPSGGGSAGGTGGGCTTYSNCVGLRYDFTCANGASQEQTESACFTEVAGECDPVNVVYGGGIIGTDAWITGPGQEGSASSSGTYFMPPAVPLEECLPLAQYFEKILNFTWRWLKKLLVPVGCYVNIFTREFNDTVVDLSVKTPGGKIDITRWFYANQWQWDPQRNNLKFENDVMYRPAMLPPSIIKGGVRYAAVGPDMWKHEVYTITRNSDGGFKWLDKHGNWIIYDSSMRSQSYGNKNGVIAAITYQQADNSRIDRILDRGGNPVIWFEYDSAGSITAVYDAQNHRVEYQYSGGRLVKVIDVLGGQTVYEYDAAGRITKTVDAAARPTVINYDSYGNVSAVFDRFGKGHAFQYGYNQQNGEFYTAITYPSGRIEEIWYNQDAVPLRIDVNGKTQLTNNLSGRIETTTNELGLATRVEYDEWKNPVKIVYADGSVVAYEYENTFNQVTKVTDQKGVVSTFEYDNKGNLIKTVKASGTDSRQITACSYDGQGRLVSLTTEADAVTEAAAVSFAYDANDNISSIIDAMGNKTEFLEYDAMGNLLQKKDSRGNTWKYFYDAKGRLTKTESPKGTFLSYEYDAANNVKAIINHYLKRFDFEYDEHNNCVKMVDTYAKSTAKEYNADNLVTKTIDQEGRENKSEYDNRERLLSEIDGAGNRVNYHYEDTAAVNILSKYYRDGVASYASSNEPIQLDYPTYKKQFYYDKLQRIVEEKDILDETTGYSIKYTYDTAGNLIALEDKQGNVTRFQYDALNRRIKITDAGGNVTENTYDSRDNLISVKDANAGVTRYSYDKNNRLIKVINPLGRETAYDYDAVGNRISAIDAKGQKIAYEYDESNRLITTRYFKAGDYVNPVKTVQFAYDAIGSLIGYNDGVTSAIYSYDDLLRKTSETVNYGAFSKTYSYAYYSNGAKKAFTGPDGIAVEYSYDENNRLSGINIPGHGQMVNNSYQWNSPAKTTFPGGIKREYAYSPLMEVKTISALDAANNSLMRYDYSYSPESNVLEKVTEHGSYAYQYDNLHRLIAAANPQNPAESYSYDSLGNRKTAAWTQAEWQYNLNNELAGFDTTSFAYDDNGNMVRKVNGAEAVNYIYDASDKLVSIEKDDTTVIASYYYDPFGRRLWKDAAGIRTYYLYSDEGLIAEYDSSGAEIKSYAYLPNSQWSTNPLYQRDHGKYYWYQNDSLGSPQKILDITGHVVWQGTYEAFGNVKITTAEIENNLRFAGQYYDKETGLYYNWNRYYNPELGRYISADPAQEGLNLYSYVFNNPNAFVDPRGLCALRKIASFGLDLIGFDEDTFQQGKDRWGALLNGDWEGFWGTLEESALTFQKLEESGQLDNLVIGLSGGIKFVGKGGIQKWWQYYPKENPKYRSKWLARGVNPPYKPGKEARKAFNLPPWNKGNAVREIKIRRGENVVGPRTPKRKPKWGYPNPGSGQEYYRGSSFPPD